MRCKCSCLECHTITTLSNIQAAIRISDCGYSDAVEGGYRHDQHVSR